MRKSPPRQGTASLLASVHKFVCILNLNYCCNTAKLSSSIIILSEDQNRDKLSPAL